MAIAAENRPEYDVAVVGLGPAGAIAAALLGTAGLKVWVCDRSHEVYDKPRAIAMDHEILRVLQQLDLVDEIAAHVEAFTPSEYYGVDGQLIKRLTMVEEPYPLAHTPSNVFTQPPVEEAIRAKLRTLPSVRVELGVEVTALRQAAEQVELDVISQDGQRSQVLARYAVGCDGASSTVRECAGLRLDDLSFDEPWLVVDVLVNERGLAKLPRTSVQFCELDRPCTLVIGPGNHRRWEISLEEGEDPALAATPERTWELLSRWLTPDDGELWRQASYRFHALVADRWRNQRVFIAGDAAHQQPPFLGQGMCQGVRDVANLAWKLTSVLRSEVRGSAAEALLDSYAEERKAHVMELTTRIKAIGAVICERDPIKARQRDERLLKEASGTVTGVPRQDIIPRLESGFLSRTDHPARGTLFPQPWLVRADERVRLDAAAGHGWRLVSLGTSQPIDPRGLTVVAIGEGGFDEESDVVGRWMRGHQCTSALVRPDHYVFGVASEPMQVDALLNEWRSRRD